MKRTLTEVKIDTEEKLAPKKYFIKTYGCLMNVADSEDIAGMLEALGFEEAISFNEADLVIVNTCSVRQAAEDKVYGLSPRVVQLKEENPEAKVLVVGCLVGSVRGPRIRFPETILHQKIPWADYLLETKAMRNLPQILLEEGLVDNWTVKTLNEYEPKRKNKKQAFVNISTGCDNFCTFCVVPFARGEEKSRSFREIVGEVENLASQGYEQVTLVGQNVNSWGIESREQKLSIRTNSQEKLPFAALLRRVYEISGIKKISFISSNPFDFTRDLVEALALEKIDRYLHLAVQSGDDAVLKRMNRRHTIEDFLELVKNIRKAVPDMQIGTDLIVGFPGETEAQFQNTVKLCQKIKFSAAYIAMYSERPGTFAAGLYEDEIPLVVKRQRHAYLTKVVEENKPRCIL